MLSESYKVWYVRILKKIAQVQSKKYFLTWIVLGLQYSLGFLDRSMKLKVRLDALDISQDASCIDWRAYAFFLGFGVLTMEISSLFAIIVSSRDMLFASIMEASDGDPALELDWRTLTAAGLPMISVGLGKL